MGISVLPEIKSPVSDGYDFEEHFFWDATVKSDIFVPTFCRRVLPSYPGQIMETAGASEASVDLYMTRRHILDDNIFQRSF